MSDPHHQTTAGQISYETCPYCKGQTGKLSITTGQWMICLPCAGSGVMGRFVKMANRDSRTTKLGPAAQKIADGLNDVLEGRYHTTGLKITIDTQVARENISWWNNLREEHLRKGQAIAAGKCQEEIDLWQQEIDNGH